MSQRWTFALGGSRQQDQPGIWRVGHAVRPQDRGSGTVWVAIALVALLAISTLVIQLGAAMIARHRAGAAADLAALAGAMAVLSGPAVVCRRARELVDAGGARLDGCQVIGMDVLVTVSVKAGLLGSRAVARARAGPDPPR